MTDWTESTVAAAAWTENAVGATDFREAGSDPRRLYGVGPYGVGRYGQGTALLLTTPTDFTEVVYG